MKISRDCKTNKTSKMLLSLFFALFLLTTKEGGVGGGGGGRYEDMHIDQVSNVLNFFRMETQGQWFKAG